MELQNFRIQIDAIDEKIVQLINERCKIASKVGEWKKERDHAIYVPEREKQLFDRLQEKNKGPISNSALRAIYREIISGAIALEKPLRIIYLDSDFNSKNAARETFGDSAEYIKSTSVSELIKHFISNELDYGVIPLTDDSNTYSEETVNELINYKNIKICAERIGSINGKAGRYFIIGLQDTAATPESRTLIYIELNPLISDWQTEIKEILHEVKIHTARELTKNQEKTTVLIEFDGHPADDKTKMIFAKFAEKIGKIHIAGGFPVLYA